MISIKTYKTDVLVIGSGGAGLRLAIELYNKNIPVLVVGKCKKRDAHTILATGGINAALGNMDPKDSWQLHAADTIRDGCFLNNPQTVITLCKNAPQAIEELARWGTQFHREKNGKITQRFFGAATYRRACFVGDHTGKAILNTLVDQAEKRKIPFCSEVYIFSLLTAGKKVNGALGFDMRTGQIITFHAKAVVLATGGHSRVFSRSSSRFWENTGDGVALAANVGAVCMDMEMFQFHPTGMVYPREAEGILVTEAVRGEGGLLTNNKGERFMQKYDPKRMELSARDIVARAIYHEIKNGRGTKHHGVWLDISHLSKQYILKRLPKMYQQFKHFAHVDISKQKMEVAPTAHYSMGGIFTDYLTGKTTVEGLYAVGEVTGGLHGANRLGGNSLAELLVFGRLIGIHLAENIKKMKLLPLDENKKSEDERHFFQRFLRAGNEDPLEVKKELQSLMWQCAGVERNGKEMKRGLKKLEAFTQRKLKITGSLKKNEQLIAALDIQQMLPVCKMILLSAFARQESRGAHYRKDYQKTLSQWKKNIYCQQTNEGIKLFIKKVPPLPKEIGKYISVRRETHLLE